MSIEKFHGIGEVTATKMHSLGIRTGADLKELKLAELIQDFGKVGHYYYKIARGQDDCVVEPNCIRKSIGAETSFAKDLSDHASMLLELEKITILHRRRLPPRQNHNCSANTLPSDNDQDPIPTGTQTHKSRKSSPWQNRLCPDRNSLGEENARMLGWNDVTEESKTLSELWLMRLPSEISVLSGSCSSV